MSFLARKGIFAISAVSVFHVSVQASDCDTLLKMGYTNIDESVSVIDSVTAAFQAACSTDYSKSTDSEKTQTEFGIQALDQYGSQAFNFGHSGQGNTYQERQTSYCTWWNSQTSYHTFASSRSEHIYQGALDAWLRCIDMEGKGIHADISPTSDYTAVTVKLWNSVGTDTLFTGLFQPQAGKARCLLAPGDGSPTTVARENTKFTLGPVASTFSCTRLSTVDKASGQRYYPATRLDFALATKENITVDLPALRLTTVSSTALQNVMKKLAQIQDNFNAVDTRSSVVVPAWAPDPTQPGVKIYKQHLDFSRAFSKAPIVTVSLNRFDIKETGASVTSAVEAQNITTTGFDAIFYSWAGNVNSIGVTFVAVGK